MLYSCLHFMNVICTNPFLSAVGTSLEVYSLLCTVTYSELGRITVVHCGHFSFHFCIEEPIMIGTALFCI